MYSSHEGIIIGNGQKIPIANIGIGSPNVSNCYLSHIDMLHMLTIDTNFVLVKKSCTDNMVFIEFDLLAFL